MLGISFIAGSRNEWLLYRITEMTVAEGDAARLDGAFELAHYATVYLPVPS